eukprot:908787-Amphidinium_carterae.1
MAGARKWCSCMRSISGRGYGPGRLTVRSAMTGVRLDSLPSTTYEDLTCGSRCGRIQSRP